MAAGGCSGRRRRWAIRPHSLLGRCCCDGMMMLMGTVSKPRMARRQFGKRGRRAQRWGLGVVGRGSIATRILCEVISITFTADTRRFSLDIAQSM